MYLPRQVHPAPSIQIDRSHFDRVVAGFGLERPQSESDIIEARKLAADLIDSSIASVGVFMTIEKVCGIGMLIYREKGKITGVAGLLNLSETGVQTLMRNGFNGPNPALSDLATHGAPVYGSYAWLGAATTHASRTAVVLVSAGLEDEIYGDLPAFAKAVTPLGAAAIQTYLGFEPLATQGQLGLYCKPKTVTHLRRAA